VSHPLFAAMTDADQDDVLRALDKVFGHYAR
jgi:dTDP-4-amino-4,6-dideoxygalactose transaminase